MKIKMSLVILFLFGWPQVVLCAPTERMPCRVQIEIKNRFKREHRKTYYFDAKNEEECARIAAAHEEAPKPAYIVKRTVEHEFR